MIDLAQLTLTHPEAAAEISHLRDQRDRLHVRGRELVEDNRLLRGLAVPLTVRVFLAPGAVLPQYQTEGAACADLHALVPEPVILQPGSCLAFPTGVHVAIPEGWEWQIRPRSGMSSRGHWTAFGTIDSDYRGEVKVTLMNLTPWPHFVEPGERIAQAKLERVARAEWHKVDSVEALGATARGAGGHGSTGR